MSNTIEPAEQQSGFDGIIYFDIKDIPAQDILSDDVEFEVDESHPYILDQSGTSSTSRTLYERRLARWKDLTTPPKTKAKCVKMCRIGPVKTCCGWKAYKKWLYRTATLRVTTSAPIDISGAVEDCIKQAAVAAAIAAIISGGAAAAAAAAEKVFFTCLSKKVGSDLLGVKIDLTSKWGGWSPI
ncbi:hypothetical protein [Pseudoalteromonas sp. MMG024]|uniref:hypothetical protein n=1 Tax=Pseudoalteromonas sp. MMG024 TaxID=2909980 RepID=UPI001F2A654E|nr:hypothetical protein [Pseudoalteromonas sp. MMG024]MCF6455524.1 hypothetical protein [Pseudoalteromonas sp. MMG024]